MGTSTDPKAATLLDRTVGKLEKLKEVIGEGPFASLFKSIEEKEKMAGALGMTPKEVAEAALKADPTPAPAPTPEPEPEPPEGEEGDEKALADLLAEVLEPFANQIGTLTEAVQGLIEGAQAQETLEKEVKELKVHLKEVEDSLAELTGEQTRSARKGFRASTSAKTEKAGPPAEVPHVDGLSSFIDDFVLGGGAS